MPFRGALPFGSALLTQPLHCIFVRLRNDWQQCKRFTWHVFLSKIILYSLGLTSFAFVRCLRLRLRSSSYYVRYIALLSQPIALALYAPPDGLPQIDAPVASLVGTQLQSFLRQAAQSVALHSAFGRKPVMFHSILPAGKRYRCDASRRYAASQQLRSAMV